MPIIDRNGNPIESRQTALRRFLRPKALLSILAALVGGLAVFLSNTTTIVQAFRSLWKGNSAVLLTLTNNSVASHNLQLEDGAGNFIAGPPSNELDLAINNRGDENIVLTAAYIEAESFERHFYAGGDAPVDVTYNVDLAPWITDYEAIRDYFRNKESDLKAILPSGWVSEDKFIPRPLEVLGVITDKFVVPKGEVSRIKIIVSSEAEGYDIHARVRMVLKGQGGIELESNYVPLRVDASDNLGI